MFEYGKPGEVLRALLVANADPGQARLSIFGEKPAGTSPQPSLCTLAYVAYAGYTHSLHTPAQPTSAHSPSQSSRQLTVLYIQARRTGRTLLMRICPCIQGTVRLSVFRRTRAAGCRTGSLPIISTSMSQSSWLMHCPNGGRGDIGFLLLLCQMRT
jgi:hypothetical protein